MTKTLVDSNSWDPVQAIEDGDALDEAHLANLAPQNLANRTAYLREGVPGKAPTMQFAIPLFDQYNANSRFLRLSSGGWLQSDITDAGELMFHIPVPVLGKIDEIHLLCDGRDGTFGSAHSGMPGTKPTIALKRVTATIGATDVTLATVGSQTDSSSTLGAYEIVHDIALTGLAHTILADTSYWLSVKGEAGANATASDFAFYRAYAVLIPS